MGRKIAGTLVGFLASLAGVAAWILLSFIGFIAGIAGALMGMLFIMVYQKIAWDDKSAYPFVIGSLIIVVDIVMAELLAVALIAATNDLSFSAALADSEIMMWVIIDVVVGLLLSFLVFGGYIARKKRQINPVNRSGPAWIGGPGYQDPNAPNPYQNPYGQPQSFNNPPDAGAVFGNTYTPDNPYDANPYTANNNPYAAYNNPYTPYDNPINNNAEQSGEEQPSNNSENLEE